MASGVLFGLTAALCWGVADYCARGATRTVGTFLTLLVVQIIAVAAFLVFVAPFGLLQLAALAHAPLSTVLAAALLNLLIMVGAALLYRAFAIGVIALVSPIAAGFAAITTLLALIFGERPTVAQIVGLILTLVGVVIASTVPNPHASQTAPVALAHGQRRRLLAPGVIESLAASVLFGVCYYALRDVSSLGGVTVAFIGKVADLVALGALALLAPVGVYGWRAWRGARQMKASPELLARTCIEAKTTVQYPWYALRLPTMDGGTLGRFLVFVIPTSLLDTAANVAYNVGIDNAGALTSVVATLSSLFSVVTVLLAWVFLRERLARWQWVGVAAIFVGVALVNW
ncbi:MAG: EamA family transporter [Ktedonobacterales bacterium]